MTQLEAPTARIPGKVGYAHPETSYVAATLVIPRAGSQRARALELIYAAGPNGLTAAQVADDMGKSRNQVATRLLELREQGWVEYLLDRTGKEVTRPTEGGNAGMVQVLTAQGHHQMELRRLGVKW